MTPHLPLKQWEPAIPVRFSSPDARAAEHTRRVLEQFEVATHPRYRAIPNQTTGRLDTWCNIFLWDFTRAMCCEIPHWVDENGRGADVGRGRELSANGQAEWLERHGIENGWLRCPTIDAELRACLGYPTIAVWKSPAGPGHVAVVTPTAPGLHIAQAGARNFEDEPITRGFGAHPFQLWTHA